MASVESSLLIVINISALQIAILYVQECEYNGLQFVLLLNYGQSSVIYLGKVYFRSSVSCIFQ